MMSLLAACTTSGENGVLSSAADNAKRQNPNATPRLANTRNALSDYCPQVTIRDGTDTYRHFRNKRDRKNNEKLQFQASIIRVARECDYVGDQLAMKIGVEGRIINGPSGASGSFKMPLRVAVSQGGETVYSVLHKPEGGIEPGRSNSQFSFVDGQVSFPAPTARNVRVYVGFDEGPYNTP
ncbi:MAG: hypothetical protein AAF468_12260 [Pseudomonadota bacterium]